MSIRVLRFIPLLSISQNCYNEKNIEFLVDDLLTATLETPLSVQREVECLAAILNHNLKTRLYIPLDGISTDAPIYDIGAIKLINMDDNSYKS